MSRKENARPFEETADLSLLEGRPAIVGFSGGADSVSLVQLLWEKGVPILAAHLNHGLRGAESDRDEEFVRSFCRERDIPLEVRRENIAALARERSVGLEECGRAERYAFFDALRRAWGGGNAVIATAHTLSDNLETILFRMARGTALDGLCGIPPRRGEVVRPILFCTRDQVEDYCRRKGLSYVTDSTNADLSYARNRIRSQAVPALLAVNAAAEQNAARMVRSLQQDRALLDTLADELYQKARDPRGLRLDVLQGAHGSLASRAAARLLREGGLSPDHAVLAAAEEMVSRGQGSVNLPGGGRLRAVTGFLRLEEPPEAETPFSLELPPPGDRGLLAIPTLPDGRKLRFQVQSAKEMEWTQKIYKNDLIFCMDYDTISGKLSIRSRLPGDRLTLFGREGSRSLKKYYSELGLTPRQRRNAWVLADEAGLLWAEYAGLSRRGAPGPGTERILSCTRERRQEGERKDE